jgi:hypothetical protein
MVVFIDFWTLAAVAALLVVGLAVGLGVAMQNMEEWREADREEEEND